MFYEHVSRQSTVDTSKHRHGKDLMLQQIYFSLYHVLDFRPGRYTTLSPFLLSSPFPSSQHTGTTNRCHPQCLRATFRPWTCQSGSVGPAVPTAKPQGAPSTSGSWKQGDARQNAPRRSMNTHRLLSCACKTNCCFLEGNFLSSFKTNINI